MSSNCSAEKHLRQLYEVEDNLRNIEAAIKYMTILNKFEKSSEIKKEIDIFLERGEDLLKQYNEAVLDFKNDPEFCADDDRISLAKDDLNTFLKSVDRIYTKIIESISPEIRKEINSEISAANLDDFGMMLALNSSSINRRPILQKRKKVLRFSAY